MAGFIIPTVSTRDNPMLLLFHDHRNPISMIQHAAVTGMDADIEIDIIITSDRPAAIKMYEIRMVPTTLLLDGDTEVNRWEGATHECDILPAIESL